MTANRVQPWLDDGDLRLYHGDALTVLQGLPAGIAQTCVTSPPYWGLRDYGADGQLGLEATPQEYVENMVALFREVWRVLRDDGTLWLNLGDSYSGAATMTPQTAYETGRAGGDARAPANKLAGANPYEGVNRDFAGLKPKDLVGIPWRVAFALQADGWYLRSDIIWSKPNPMPESVTDRPTKAHEYLFLFAKQPRYYMDMDAIREAREDTNSSRWDAIQTHGHTNGDPTRAATDERSPYATHSGARRGQHGVGTTFASADAAGRNRRSVWTIPTQPFPEAHFATYPEELVRPCILAGTSERGECVECGAPWRRQVERELEVTRGQAHPDTRRDPMDASSKPGGIGDYQTAYGRYKVETTGWAPSCSCLERAIHDDPTPEQVAIWTRPQLVLDPFIGSGTTALVARKHGRRSLGIDLSTEYLEIAAKRTQQLSLLGGVA